MLENKRLWGLIPPLLQPNILQVANLTKGLISSNARHNFLTQKWWQPDKSYQLPTGVSGADESQEGEVVATGKGPIPKESPQ